MPRLLIVEDEVATWLALRLQAESAAKGLTVTRFRGRTSEFESWSADIEAPDLVIVDLQLPDQNGINPDGGFEIIESLQRNRHKCRTIILTCRTDDQARKKARDLPSVFSFLTKPWNQDELNAAIRSCLDATATARTQESRKS